MFFYKSFNSQFVLDKWWWSQRSIRVQVKFTSLSSLTFSLRLSWVCIVYIQKINLDANVHTSFEIAYDFLCKYKSHILHSCIYCTSHSLRIDKLSLRSPSFSKRMQQSILNLEISMWLKMFRVVSHYREGVLERKTEICIFKKKQEVWFVISSREHSA